MSKIIHKDYRKMKDIDELHERVCKELDTIIEEVKVEDYDKNPIQITNISSAVFCDLFDIEPNDFNGWQCDWWGDFTYNGNLIHVFGEAWYARVKLTVSDLELD